MAVGGFSLAPEDCVVDLGTMILLGPTGKDFATCVRGRSCSATITGTYLSTNDTMFVSKECAGSLKADMSFSLQTGLVASDGSSTLMLTNTLPPASGGQYKLCWCSRNSPCSSTTIFSVEAGDLILQGPYSNEQDRTCVSGRTCLVDGIQEQDLLDSDLYLIQDTCGSNQILASTVNAGQDVSVVASGAVVKWGLDSHTLAGGLYKLCWCSDRPTDANISWPGLCTSAETYRSTVGNLALRGPAPLQQDKTCISGQVCNVEAISGFLLDVTGDSVMVLDTCGHPGRRSPSRGDSSS